jgi:uncharacterized protein YqeY
MIRGEIHHARTAMLREKFNEALKDAMRAKDARKVGTLRLINSALKDKDIEARGLGKAPLNDEEVLALLQKMIKQRNDSIEAYEKAGRADLVAQEQEEKAIIEAYLPQQMDLDEVKAAVKAVIASTGAASVKDMGKVMGELKAKFAGKMDFSKANGVVKELLSGAGG